MPILPLQTELKETNKILRARSEEIKNIADPEIQTLIRNMRETLTHAENGIGLAAPQVGKNLRLFIASPLLKLNQTVFINPIITRISQKTELMKEGCLSVSNMHGTIRYGTIRRAQSLKVEAYNEHGRKFKMKAEGLIAQLVQHEIGHLNGQLFIDTAKNMYVSQKPHTNKKHNIIFMGTPRFAETVLERLIASEIYKPCLVIVQPDKPIGRKQILTPPPVKICAQKHGIEVWQPSTLKDANAVEKIKSYGPDCIIVTAYGKLIPQSILNIPPRGIVNAHASLLPRYRGASPIQRTILSGDKTTGITLMLIDKGLDTGPIIKQTLCTIADDESYETLYEKLAQLGADMLIETLPQWLEGKITPQAQDDAKATYAPILQKHDGEIKPEHNAATIERMVRALNPWPGVSIKLKAKSEKRKNQEEKILKILKAKIAPCEHKQSPLTFSLSLKKELLLSTRDGCLTLDLVQLESKKPMSGYDFYLGNK